MTTPLDPRNRDLAYDRIGPLMWEEEWSPR